MDRRRFLALGGASVLSVAVSGVWTWSDPPLQPTALAHPPLLSMLEAPERVRELGRRYRSMVPTEDDRSALIAALHDDIDSGSDAPVRQRLDERTREDFAEGRTVMLDGWVLSVTEARQCALLSLAS